MARDGEQGRRRAKKGEEGRYREGKTVHGRYKWCRRLSSFEWRKVCCVVGVRNKAPSSVSSRVRWHDPRCNDRHPVQSRSREGSLPRGRGSRGHYVEARVRCRHPVPDLAAVARCIQPQAADRCPGVRRFAGRHEPVDLPSTCHHPARDRRRSGVYRLAPYCSAPFGLRPGRAGRRGRPPAPTHAGCTTRAEIPGSSDSGARRLGAWNRQSLVTQVSRASLPPTRQTAVRRAPNPPSR